MKNLFTVWANRLRRQPNAGSYTSYEEVERAERIFYLEYLRQGMTVFDVGASIGELTLLFSRFVDPGKVHAFEASQTAFERLGIVCHASGLRNVVLNHLALRETQGTVRLNVYDEDHLAWNSQALRPLETYGINVKPVSIEEVVATTVDLYCEKNDIAEIDLLKIDVEGAEFQVLLGAGQMLATQRIACVVFEFGQTTFDMGNDPTEIENYLSARGYQVRNLVASDPVFPGRASAQTAQFSMHIATPII